MRYLFVVVAVVFASFGCTKDGDPDRVWVGSTLPVFEVTDVTSTHTYSSTSRGRLTLIYLFWSECISCQEQTPAVVRLAAAYPQIDVICLARGGGDMATQQQAESYWSGLINQPSLNPLPALYYDANRAVFNLFAKRDVPRIYIADGRGVIRSAYAELQSYEVLEGEITKLLQ